MTGRGYRSNSVAGLVIAALETAAGPLTLDELEQSLRDAGWEHTTEVRNPRQLRASITAVPHKSTWVVRTGRGRYDLANRARART